MTSRLRIGLTARTVLVRGGNVQSAFRNLNKVLQNTGIEAQIKSKRFYEKPTWKRVRKNYEKCARIYHREMKRKIDFVMRQNDPLPPTAVMGLKTSPAFANQRPKVLN